MERWSKTLNTRLARGGAMAWYSVDERLLTIRLAPKIAQPVTCQPSPRRAACTTITTRAATERAEAMPEVMLLAISSPRLYSLPTTGVSVFVSVRSGKAIASRASRLLLQSPGPANPVRSSCEASDVADRRRLHRRSPEV